MSSGNTSVIREFLVALGYRNDEAGLKKFESGIEQATKTVVRLATAVTATAVAVSVGVTKMASNLEALYFASIKTGASATNLKAFDRALQNLGTEAGEGLESVQALARFLRTNPGGEGYLRGLGVQTRDVNRQLLDTTDMLVDMAEKFRQMPYFLASQRAQLLGISEDTLRAMRSPGFEDEVRRMRAQMRDIGFEKASRDAHRFMMDLRGLLVQLEAFSVRVYDALSQHTGGGLRRFIEWLRANGPMLADRLADILAKLVALLARLGPLLGWVVDKLYELDKATDGWSTKLLLLGGFLKMFGGFKIVSGVFSLATAFVRLASAIGTVGTAASAAGSAGLLGWLLGPAAAGAAGYGIGTLVHKVMPDHWNDAVGRWVAKSMMLFRSSTAREAVATNDPVGYFQMLGWSKANAEGLVANLIRESNLNPRAVGDHGLAQGIAQWHPDRQAAFKNRFGKDLKDASLAEQMNFVDYELRLGNERAVGALLAAATSQRQSAEIVSRRYLRPANADAEATRRGEMAMQLSQQTTIHLHGSGNGQADARAVERAADRANERVVRSFATLTR